MNVLKEHLGKHQLKFTRQRELILTAFLRQEHITAEAMYHQLAKTDPHLGTRHDLSNAELVLRRRHRAGPPFRLPNTIR